MSQTHKEPLTADVRRISEKVNHALFHLRQSNLDDEGQYALQTLEQAAAIFEQEWTPNVTGLTITRTG